MKKNKVVILDNGHGKNTPGKCSPDKIFYEWSWSRTFVNKLKTILENQNYIVFNIVPEEENISLSERAERANTIINKYGAKNCIFISIHNNAAGNGRKWYNVSGWEVFTTKGKTNSDKLAEYFASWLIPENELEMAKEKYNIAMGYDFSILSCNQVFDISDVNGNTISMSNAHAYGIKEITQDYLVIITPWDSKEEIKISKNEYLKNYAAFDIKSINFAD